MVTRWGMSERLGPLQYAENQEEVFLGHSVTRTQNVSEKTAQLIDEEIKRIVMTGYERAKQVLTEHIDELHALAAALLEYETLSGEEIRKVIAGEPIDRGDPAERAGPPALAPGSAIPKVGRRKPGQGFGPAAPQPAE
jgi:cell division protease FtsH